MSSVLLRQTLKSASFRLTAAYAGLFAVSVGALAAITYFSLKAELTHQFRSPILAESIALEADYKTGGVPQILRAIRDRQRSRLIDGLDFTLYDSQGRQLFGTMARIACNRGWTTIVGPPDGDEPPGELEQLGVYVTPLPNGLCLLVGDDWGEVENYIALILKTFGWVFLLSLTMAVGGGLFLSSEFLKRIEAMTRSAEAIIEGDINRRLPRREAPDDLDRLAATLNRMLDRTSSLTERLKHLSNDIAHDLRTPLGRLRRQLDEARMANMTPAEYRALLENSVTDVDEILGTFGAILRIAQIESGSRRSGFQRLCLSEVVADVCETFIPVFEEEGRVLSPAVAPNLWIQGDEELITVSLANLLDNAVTHTPPGSHIRVSLAAADGQISLTVADDGPGVPEVERTRIFQRFYRLESSRTTPGNGLGLSMVAAIAELHTAQLVADDNRPGLRIAMRFPIAA